MLYIFLLILLPFYPVLLSYFINYTTSFYIYSIFNTFSMTRDTTWIYCRLIQKTSYAQPGLAYYQIQSRIFTYVPCDVLENYFALKMFLMPTPSSLQVFKFLHSIHLLLLLLLYNDPINQRYLYSSILRHHCFIYLSLYHVFRVSYRNVCSETNAIYCHLMNALIYVNR